MSSSLSVARDLKRLHRSMVKRVAEELKMEVREDMMAESMTAISRPLSPTGSNSSTSLG
jgi:hypothetical protein